MFEPIYRSRPGADALAPASADQAEEIAPGLWCSPGLSNSYLLTTDEGRVIVNTGMGFEGPVHRANFDAVDSSPVRYIIVTQGHVDHECQFVAEHLARVSPRSILDIGSHRQFVLGLLAHYLVTTVDVRPRRSVVGHEIVLVGDARSLPLAGACADAVVSLCAVEHFGLGRYGDPFDPSGDLKAFGEMTRVLRPGGHLLFTTTITNAAPSIVFNAHRIYTLPMLREMSRGLELVEERFFNPELPGFCRPDEVTTVPHRWNVYMGCLRKPLAD